MEYPDKQIRRIAPSHRRSPLHPPAARTPSPPPVETGEAELCCLESRVAPCICGGARRVGDSTGGVEWVRDESRYCGGSSCGLDCQSILTAPPGGGSPPRGNHGPEFLPIADFRAVGHELSPTSTFRAHVLTIGGPPRDVVIGQPDPSELLPVADLRAIGDDFSSAATLRTEIVAVGRLERELVVSEIDALKCFPGTYCGSIDNDSLSSATLRAYILGIVRLAH